MALLHAWTADDAFISFRVVDQLARGNGAVFNLGERVQVATHPLWLGVLAVMRLARLDVATAHIWLSLTLFGAGAFGLLWTFRENTAAVVLTALAMTCSRAIVDFATSGLETSLSFFLFALAIDSIRARHWRIASLCIALLPLNRLDLVPLAFPFAVLVYLDQRKFRDLVLMAAPTVLWLAFAVVYYGSPLPNTAFAKLGLPWWVRVDGGLAYIVSSLLTDPGALTLLAGALLSVYTMRARSGRNEPLARAAIAAGLLSLLACAWEGGDFMLGRFILPFLWAASVLVASVNSSAAFALALSLALLQVVTGQSTATLWLDGGVSEKGKSYYGAIDERRFWVAWTGLFAKRPVSEISTALPARDEAYLMSALGLVGYRSAPGAKLVDRYGLTDPLLARVSPVAGRAGHLYRPFPEEFWKWRDPAHRFADPALEALARDMRLAHASAEFLSVARAAAILRLMTARIHGDALRVEEEGGRADIRLKPRPLYRPLYGNGDYLVRMRLDDANARRTDALPPSIEKYPVAIGDEKCTLLPAGEGEGAVALRVREGMTLVVNCPAAAVREGLVIAIGRDGPDGIRFDEAMAIGRPPFTWLAAVPQWLVWGWDGRPRPAVAFAILIAILSLALMRREQRRRSARVPGF